MKFSIICIYVYIHEYMKFPFGVYEVSIYMLYIHYLYISYIHLDTQGWFFFATVLGDLVPYAPTKFRKLV